MSELERDPCERCGQVHDKCRGHNRRGLPCGKWPMPDQEICRQHGGMTPQMLDAAARRRIEREARAALREKWADGADVTVEDPLAELSRLAGEVVAFKDYLRGMVEDMDGQLTQKWSERTIQDVAIIKEDVRAIVSAYERALDRAAKVLAGIVKLDIAGKQLEINTARAELIVQAVHYGLGQVDMEAAIRNAAQDAIADALENLSRTRKPAPKELAG